MQKIKNGQYGFGLNSSNNPVRYVLFGLILISITAILFFKFDIHQKLISSLSKKSTTLKTATQLSSNSKISSISGLAIPRFVSLKDDEVNVRRGPSTDYEVAWVFFKKSLPVEVTNEFGNWRQIRDSDGQEGWVFHTLLSSKRTVIFAPWEKGGNLALYESPNRNSNKTALIEPGVIGSIESCDMNYCSVIIQNISGYIEKKYLWGIYPDENIK